MEQVAHFAAILAVNRAPRNWLLPVHANIVTDSGLTHATVINLRAAAAHLCASYLSGLLIEINAKNAMTDPALSQHVLQFIATQIDTVPQLECLVLLYQHEGQSWLTEEVSARIYVPPQGARATLETLQRRGLLTVEGEPPRYRFNPQGPADPVLMGEVVAQYQRHVVRIATLIHAKASASVREFARAFDLKKDR